MNKAEVNRFKAVLMKTREAIVGKARERESIWIAPSNELMETVQLAGEREFAIRALESQTKSLAQIDAALERIEDGDFGVCLECEEQISAKRLAAVPWAIYCLHCQELEDTRQTVGARVPSLAA